MSNVFCFMDMFVVLVIGSIICLSNQPTYLSPSSLLPTHLSTHHSPTCPPHSPIYPPTHPRIPYFPALCWDQKLPSVGIQQGTQDLGLGLGAPDVVGGRARNISGVKCVGCAETHGDHPKLLGEEKQEGPGE